MNSPQWSKKTKEDSGKRADLPDPTPLLLSEHLSRDEVADLFHAYNIQDWTQADENLQSMAGEPSTRKVLATILLPILTDLSDTPDPDQGLNEWERFVGSGIHRLQLFQFLSAAPHLIQVLGTVFGSSPAMAQTLMRDPLLVYWLEEDRVLVRRQTRAHMKAQIARSISGVKNFEAKCEALRRWKRREMLRIGIRDLLGIASVIETYTLLSELAGLVVETAYKLVEQDIQRRHGMFEDTPSSNSIGFAVLGMGKLGGWELNYSSDIDLVYVYQASKDSTCGQKGQVSISPSVYFETLAQELTTVLSAPSPEGALFRVDLRLRPEGTVGPLVCSVEDALHYYATRGRTWERLAFLKAKPIAGNLRVGNLLLRRLKKFVYGEKKDVPQVIPAIQALRSQILKKMTRRRELERHVKLGTGGIREIEFIVQGLQLRWGYLHPAVRDRQTLKGLTKLVRLGKLNIGDMQRLKRAYLFLRNLEHKLQMVNELQTHVIPSKAEDIAKCAIRLGYPKHASPKKTLQPFWDEYRQHTETVHRLYRQIIGP